MPFTGRERAVVYGYYTWLGVMQTGFKPRQPENITLIKPIIKMGFIMEWAVLKFEI